MSNDKIRVPDGYEDKVRKGQAINLAVAVAVAEGKQLEDKFIIKQVARFLKLTTIIQNSSVEDILKLTEKK